jgi:hypothetical protein
MPNTGLKLTIVGTPYDDPITPTNAKIKLPTMEPKTIIIEEYVKGSERPCVKRAPACSTSNPIERLVQNTNMSIALSCLKFSGTGSIPHSGGGLIRPIYIEMSSDKTLL